MSYNNSRTVRDIDEYNTGDEVLLYAVLELAIEDIMAPKHDKRNTRQSRILQAQSIAWLTSEEEKWLYSYKSICRELDIDFKRLRSKVMKKAYEKV